MKNNLKGSALIVVIMVVTILVILGVGQLVLVDQITKVSSSEQTKNQLFWAAEAGANHAFYALDECTGDTKSNLDGNAAAAATLLTTKLEALTFGNVTTKVTVDYTSPKFKITSVATLNGKTCTVVIDELLGIPPLDFPMIIHNGMENGKGLDPGTNMFGKTYFGGWANPITYDNGDGTFDTPVFWGPVISSATKNANPSVYYKGFNANQNADMSKFFENGDYAAGLHLNNRIKTTTGNNSNSADYTKEQVVDRVNQMFKGTYKYAQPLPDAKALTLTWSEFSAYTDNVTKISTSDVAFSTHAGKDIKIVFNGNTASVYFKKVDNATLGDGTGSDSSKYYPTPTVIDLTSTSTNGHLLLIDKNFGSVFIEGNIGASTTMVTEANNVVITDDLYYTELNGKTWNGTEFKDIPTSAYQNPTTAQEAFLTMQAEVNKVTTKFAVIAGANTTDELKSRISVSPTPAVNNPSKSVFTTGAFFSSSGRHGIESYRNNDGNDQGYWKIGGTGKGQIAIVNIGCMAFKTKGKYSQEYKNATDRGCGIVTVFGTDLRYIKGISPFGFKTVRFSDKKRWSVSWN